MAKGTVVRGTPINHVGPSGAFIGNAEGFGAKALPKNYSGGSQTTPDQFEGDQKGNSQVEAQTGQKYGTPAQSMRGNPDEALRVRADFRYGVSPGAGGVDMNDPMANGNGVILDGIDRASGYNPRDAATMDSPVLRTAPMFDTRTIAQENLAHMGQGIGAVPGNKADVLTNIGGVMSRGLVGTSKSTKPETELASDDTLER